ncbi:MAG: metallophosphoesterase [Caldiserica bacterium]|nr:metallophosphoesterase [Caldisericota bacterium]
MKWGIISDTHDNLSSLKKAINIFRQQKVKIIFHAGDFISPFTVRLFEGFDGKLIGVFGNNDGEKIGLKKAYKNLGEIHEDFFLGEVEGKRIFLTHKGDLVPSLAKSGDIDILIYGHTHKQEIKQLGHSLVINPGECGGWLSQESTIALLDPEALEAKIISL